MTLALTLAAALCLSGDPDTAKVTVEFEKTSLSDVLSNLTLLTEVPIELDDAARKKLGDPDAIMISVKIKDTSLTAAIKLIVGRHGLAVNVVDHKKLVVTVR